MGPTLSHQNVGIPPGDFQMWCRLTLTRRDYIWESMARDPAAPEPAAPDRSKSPAAERALAEAAARRAARDRAAGERPQELGGRGGHDPTRYGDWEVKGLASDF
jgi:hypothetical protein